MIPADDLSAIGPGDLFKKFFLSAEEQFLSQSQFLDQRSGNLFRENYAGVLLNCMPSLHELSHDIKLGL